jgi:hypothetical protein
MFINTVVVMIKQLHILVGIVPHDLAFLRGCLYGIQVGLLSEAGR